MHSLLTSLLASAALAATPSVDPLPTVQIDGIVWAQVTVGNTVYATGRFANARPAGVALGGAGTVARANLLAFDITTGVLKTDFVHSLTGTGAEGRAIAASPDGRRLYVGGKFSAVDGQAHANFAAFDLTTGALLGGFSGTNGVVQAVAATNARAYVGGSFSTAGGQSRQRVAAYEANGALATNWAPSITSNNNSFIAVSAMVVTPAQGNLVVGGSFNRVNGLQYLSNVALKLDTGAPVTPWASTSSSFPIRDQVVLNAPSGNGSAISSLTTDGTRIFLTSWGYGSAYLDGFFEGRAALSAVDGSIVWINDCHGDSYSAFPVGGVLYSAGHPHDCRPMGLWGDLPSQRALAETTTGITGTNVPPELTKYSSFAGYPHTAQLNWYPTLDTGTVSGSSQAAWSVTGNSQYLSYGGEFLHAEGKAQQGLVRYAVRALAPNLIGPKAYKTYGVTVGGKGPDGSVIVTLDTTSDPDDGTLEYQVYRDTLTTPIYIEDHASAFWSQPAHSFTDVGIKDTSHTYRMVAIDPYGRSVTTYSLRDDTDPKIVYAGGGWVSQQGLPESRNAYNNGIHYTGVNGATATFTFVGTAVSFVTERSTTRGTISISVDGGAATVIDAHTTATGYIAQQTMFTKSGLTRGTHTIRVTKTGGTNMVVDGFRVIP